MHNENVLNLRFCIQYHYPSKLRLTFLNFWNGEAITDTMAGCALLCIGQKLHMMDESGMLRVTEAMELMKANEAGNLFLILLLFTHFRIAKIV